MPNEEHLHILKQGVEEWNRWRVKNLDILPNLSEADLSEADLSRAILSRSNLRGIRLYEANLDYIDLTGADLSRAELGRAKLRQAHFYRADLYHADLSNTELSGANMTSTRLYHVDLSKANLRGARLSYADLTGADLTGADLRDADLTNGSLIGANLTRAIVGSTKLQDARISQTIFAELDLRGAEGLESVRHIGPSEVAVSTIYRSEGNIPEAFLLGCGVPESLIVQIPALVGAVQPIQFYSCFISYSSKDEEFARRLHSRMREARLRVWFAPEDMKGGDKLYEQIDRAIQVHDRLLLVLSESSLQSKWVELESRRARKVERQEGRRKLFPIRLVGYEALQEWTCIDSTTGEDLAEEVRSYFIPDFSTWKSHDDFERAFARLLTDLKASA